MLLKTSEIIGRKIDAADGEIGKIMDIYFDDKSWVIRYFVVDVGTWQKKREVLLIPSAIKNLDNQHHGVSTSLTRQQIMDSPPAESDIPVSRQYEIRLHSYYGWLQYWTYPALAGLGIYTYPAPVATEDSPAAREKLRLEEQKLAQSDTHLRNATEVKGYSIKAIDGELGHVEDLLFDSDQAMRFTHFIVDTVNWWPSKNVVIDVATVNDINWNHKQIEVSIDCEMVKGAPEYDRSRIIDESYQTQISAYFRRAIEAKAKSLK
jgi:uncharacterized protein YrrD